MQVGDEKDHVRVVHFAGDDVAGALRGSSAAVHGPDLTIEEALTFTIKIVLSAYVGFAS